jgi:rod shape-determining protein MreD
MRNLVFYIIAFFAYVIMQAFFKNLILFNVSFCFFYVAFILLMPVETDNLVLMIAGFIIGFVIDMFYDSLGLHALSMVLIGYIRNYWLSVIAPQGGYDASALPNLSSQGVQWFLVYAMPLIFIHHLTLFLTEAAGNLFWYSMLKAIASLLFTVTAILLMQYLLPQRSRV